jgi:hypothetical protein
MEQKAAEQVISQIVTIATREVLDVWWPRLIVGAVLVFALSWALYGFLLAVVWLVTYAVFAVGFVFSKVSRKARQIYDVAEQSIIQYLSIEIVGKSDKVIGRLGDSVAYEWVDVKNQNSTKRFIFHSFGEPSTDMPEGQVWLLLDGITYIPDVQPARKDDTIERVVLKCTSSKS